MSEEPIRLTQYSKGGGCGCKIAPSVLQQIIAGKEQNLFPDLLVGNETGDDAAVYQLNGETAVISTADFFMPIVDDAFHFGQIAAANAISDVYAMGGTPLMAIAILGWPVNKLPVETAQRVMEGGKDICRQAHVPLAGGHSVDAVEPLFGLAVTGTVSIANLKKNSSAQPGDFLFLTKPLGTGIMATAVKKGLLLPEHYGSLIKQITTLNSIGAALGKVKGVHAMTDVTGFGILGHAVEMAEGSGVSIELYYHRLQKMNGLDDYLKQAITPGATARNWNSYKDVVQLAEGIDATEAPRLLPDPQTNGGLLIAVAEEALEEVKNIFRGKGLQQHVQPVGRCTTKKEKTIYVQSEGSL